MSESHVIHLDDDERKWPAMQRSDEFYTRYRSSFTGVPLKHLQHFDDNIDKKKKKKTDGSSSSNVAQVAT